MRPDTIKLLEETGRTLSGINCSNIFFDPSPRIMEIKTKINKLDQLKLKVFHRKRNNKLCEKTTHRLG